MRLDALARKTEDLLRERRLSTADAAAVADLDPVTVWKMTKGRRVSPDTLRKFALAFGEPPGEWIRVGRPELVEAMEAPQLAESPITASVEIPIVGYIEEYGTIRITSPAETGRTVTVPIIQGEVPTEAYAVTAYGLLPALRAGDLVVVRAGREGVNVGDAVLIRSMEGRHKRIQLVKYLGEGEDGLLLIAPVNAAADAPGHPLQAELMGVVLGSYSPWRRT